MSSRSNHSKCFSNRKYVTRNRRMKKPIVQQHKSIIKINIDEFKIKTVQNSNLPEHLYFAECLNLFN